MKKSSGDSGQPIGAKAVWLAVLFLVVLGTGIIVFRQKNKSPAPAEEAAQAPVSNAAPEVTRYKANPFNNLFRPVPTVVNADTDALIAQLFDASAPLKTRREAARALAKLGNDEAMAALKKVLASDAPAFLKSAIAEGLGECPNPEAVGILHTLVNDKDEIVARGAVRGLALRGDNDAVEILGNLLFNEQARDGVRAEVALALGDVNLSTAKDLLLRAMGEIKDADLLESVIDGLGRRPFSETEDFFTNYLNSPDVSAEKKVLAIQALAEAEGNVAPFLQKFLNDPNQDVRAAAAQALQSAEPNTQTAAQLGDALKQESNPSARAGLYQALGSQSGSDVQALLPLVQGETDPKARLAGLRYLAGNLQSSPDAAEYFNQTAVPELEKGAIGSGDLSVRLLSVLALGRAQTPDANNALQRVARDSNDPKVVAAANAALRNTKPR